MEDPISMAIYQYLMTTILDQHLSIIAVLDEDVPNPKIVGFQILSVSSKADSPLPEVKLQ